MANDFIKISHSNGIAATIPFRNIVELINEGIFCVNSDGILEYVNRQFCKNLGYNEAEVLGKPIFDFFYDERHSALSREKLEIRRKGVSDVYDIKMKRKNGEGVWVRVNGKPVFNEKGDFVGSIAIHMDVTEQKKMEEELIFAKEDLETKVVTRTRQLSEVNQKLQQEIKERKLTEISLKNSEKRFRDIFYSSPDAIYVENYEGEILDVNEATCKLHECEKEFLIGKSIYEITPTYLRAELAQRQSKIISGNLSQFESECIAQSGKTIPIEVSAAKIEFRSKPALLMHVRDISDRRKHQKLLQELNQELEEKVKQRTAELQKQITEKEKFEAELQLQKNYLRLIIDSTPNMIFVKDAEGKFLLANESTAQFYNLTPKEMEGHLDSEEQFTKDVLDYFQWQDQQVIGNREAIKFPETRLTNQATGETFWIQTIKKPIPAEDGVSWNILGVATDITEIKEAKEQLRISEQLYREIARNLPKAAMFIFDSNMQYILAEGPLVGIISKPKEEIEGKAIRETIRESERERVESVYRKILEGESSESEQVFLGRSLKVYHTPIANEEGKIIYGMVMILDITDLKETERELEKRAHELQRSNEELERFAYVASHDLQSPLRTIASYLQLLEMRYRDKLDPEALEFIDFSVNGAKRMQTVITELLNYSKISSVRKPFVKTDVKDIVSEVVRNLDANIKLAGASIQISDMPIISCVPGQLYQIFQNLIDNGIKFVKDKQPEIKIAATEKEDEWEFTVSDNGIGIKEEFREKIFQIFQRLHSHAEYPGSGVGLAICKKIVELHGGRIWVESTVGQGTTFHFTVSKNLEGDKQRSSLKS
ncbi:MAG: PAS domain S-box protein [Chitinophagales bacterium]|nr:PAS domain S-box protein [Chitinophagales bacterium]